MTGPKSTPAYEFAQSERPCERLAHKSVVVTRLFFPVKKIALDLTGGVFGYIAKAIF